MAVTGIIGRFGHSVYDDRLSLLYALCPYRRGLGCVERRLKGRITLLSGHSGVGKSTIINKLIPGVNLRTGDISEYHNKGMHTTTFSEMIPLSDGGYLIDTPGIKGFGTIEMEGAEIAHYFPEIFKFSLIANSITVSHRP